MRILLKRSLAGIMAGVFFLSSGICAAQNITGVEGLQNSGKSDANLDNTQQPSACSLVKDKAKDIATTCSQCSEELQGYVNQATAKQDQGLAAAKTAALHQGMVNLTDVGNLENQELIRKAALGDAGASSLYGECAAKAEEGLRLALLPNVQKCNFPNTNETPGYIQQLGDISKKCLDSSIQSKGLAAALMKNAGTIGLMTAGAAAVGVGGWAIGKAMGNKDDDDDDHNKKSTHRSSTPTCARDETLVNGICKTTGATGVNNQSTQEAIEGVSTTLGMNVGTQQNLTGVPTNSSTATNGNTLSSGQGTAGTVGASGRNYATDSGGGASGGALSSSGSGGASGSAMGSSRGMASGGGSYSSMGGGSGGALSSEPGAITQESFVNVRDSNSVQVMRGGKLVWVSCSKEPGLAACKALAARKAEKLNQVKSEARKYLNR